MPSLLQMRAMAQPPNVRLSQATRREAFGLRMMLRSQDCVKGWLQHIKDAQRDYAANATALYYYVQAIVRAAFEDGYQQGYAQAVSDARNAKRKAARNA